LGLKAEERIGANLFERIHPDDLKFAMDAFNKFTLDKLSKDINTLFDKYVFVIRMEAGGLSKLREQVVHDNFVEFVIVNLRDITSVSVRRSAAGGQRALPHDIRKYRHFDDSH